MRKTITAMMMAGLLALAGCASGGTSTAGTSSPRSTTTPAAIAGAVPSTTTTEPTYTPTPADFTITVKVRKKECFGSAGCNVTYRIDPSYAGEPLDSTWSVTYEVHGGEDGPQINTFTIDGDQASFDSEETISTSSSKKKLTVKVTDVSPE